MIQCILKIDLIWSLGPRTITFAQVLPNPNHTLGLILTVTNIWVVIVIKGEIVLVWVAEVQYALDYRVFINVVVRIDLWNLFNHFKMSVSKNVK